MNWQNERRETHVWRYFYESLSGFAIGGLMLYWSSQSDGAWGWFFLGVGVFVLFIAFGDVRRFFDELDRRADIKREHEEERS